MDGEQEFYDRSSGWSDQTIRRIIGVAIVLIVGALIVASGTSNDGSEPDPAVQQQTEPDDDDTGPRPLEMAAAENACRHYHNARVDLGSGVLSVGEFRQKLREVNRDAQLSGVEPLVSASRDLLAAVTQMDEAALEPARDAMDAACEPF